MADFPRVMRIKRGGKYRTVIFTQPYFPRCLDVTRAVWMSL